MGNKKNMEIIKQRMSSPSRMTGRICYASLPFWSWGYLPQAFLQLKEFHSSELSLMSSSLREECALLNSQIPRLFWVPLFFLLEANKRVSGREEDRAPSQLSPMLTLPFFLWYKIVICFSWVEGKGWGVGLKVNTGTASAHSISFIYILYMTRPRLLNALSQTQHFYSCSWQTLIHP